MREALPSPGSFYVAGGTLRPGTPSYIIRQADSELYKHLLAGDFCYVLTARQMGKSSLMARTAKRLEEEGVRAAIVDLSQIGTERSSAAAAQWYFGVAHEIHRRLGSTIPLRIWWQEHLDLPALQRLTGFFREVALSHRPSRVVIFFDEVDLTIGLPFADDFFAAIRACYNERATEPAFEHLTFALLGVATPDQLIQDSTRTPFNVGRRIDLADFKLEEMELLAEGLHSEPEVAAQRLERIFYWTGGHPYQTQALCHAVEENWVEMASPEALVDLLVEELFLSHRAQREETNLAHARARLDPDGAQGQSLIRLYQRVLAGNKIGDEPNSPLFAQLKLSGVVKVRDDSHLAVRNRIYASVFSPRWVKSEIHADGRLHFAAAILASVLIGLLLYSEFYYPRIYVQQIQAAVKSDAYEVASEAYLKLRSIPFWHSRADKLLAEFWDQRALKAATKGDRDRDLLCRLKALEAQDAVVRRKEVQALVGDDYLALEHTLRYAYPIAAMALESKSSNVLATNSRDSVFYWDPARGPALTLRAVTDPGGVLYSRFARNGGTLLLLDWQGNLKKVDPATGRLIESISTGMPHRQESTYRFSADGFYVLGYTPTGCAWIWDRRAKSLHNVICRGAFFTAAISTDGKLFALATNQLEIWSLTPRRLLATLPVSFARDLEFSQDSRLISVSDKYGALRIWDWKTGEPVGPLLYHGSAITSSATSFDNHVLLTGGVGAIRLWQSRSWGPKGLTLHRGNPRLFRLLRSNRAELLLASEDGAVSLWSDGRVLPLWRAASGTHLELDPSGQFAIEKSNSVARLYAAETGDLICSFSVSREFSPRFSLDGQMVEIFDGDKVRLLDPRNCQFAWPLSRLNFKGSALSEDRELMAVESGDGEIRILNTWSGLSYGSLINLPDPAAAIAFTQGGASREFIVATDRWLYRYSLEGASPRLRSARLLRGTWGGAFRFVPGCADCLDVVQGYSDSFFVETIHFDEPNCPPIQGNPKDLLAHWQQVLALQFDKKTGAFLPL